MAGSCEHGNEPYGSINCGEFIDWATVSFSRRTLLHGVKFSVYEISRSVGLYIMKSVEIK
jgi:hypothetical protein